MKKINNLEILSIPIYSNKFKNAIDHIITICDIQRKNNFCVSETGAHGIINSTKDHKFRNILQNFFLNLPDGMPNVWVGKIKGFKYMERCYGPDIFKSIIKESANHSINHFFCGGKPGVAKELKKVCETEFGNKNIVGTYSPPFHEMTDNELLHLSKKINSKDTDIVWVGLSTPKQEIFAERLSKYTNVHFLIIVGAAFDFYTGNVRQSHTFI